MYLQKLEIQGFKSFAILRIRTYEFMHPDSITERRRVVFEALGYGCQKEKSDQTISILPGLTVKVEVEPRRDQDFDAECGLDPDRALNPDEVLKLKNLFTKVPDEVDEPLILKSGDWDEIELIS